MGAAVVVVVTVVLLLLLLLWLLLLLLLLGLPLDDCPLIEFPAELGILISELNILFDLDTKGFEGLEIKFVGVASYAWSAFGLISELIGGGRKMESPRDLVGT